MFSACTSNYFFKSASPSAIARQRQYVERVSAIIENIVGMIKGAVNDGEDLTHTFEWVLLTAGTWRHEIAMEQQDEDSAHFGVFRAEEKPGFHPTMLTELSGQYKAYNHRLLKVLQSYLRNMSHTLENFQQTELIIDHEPCCSKKNSLEIQIFNPENFDRWGLDFTREQYEALCKISEVEPEDSSKDEGECFTRLSRNKSAMLKLKTNDIVLYKKFKLFCAMNEVYRSNQHKKSDWVLATVRCEIEGKSFALTQYLTWMYRDYQIDPVKNMTACSIIHLMHQDVFLIERMIKDIAKLFKTAIEWDGRDQNMLIQTVGLISYEFAHAMPYKRGSAAISEWIESAIYNYHGLKLRYNQDTSVNMEALILPLKAFIDSYPTMISLEPLAARSTNTP